MIYFDGISSDDIGVYVEYYPSYVLPLQKYEKISVPGRSGDILFPQEAYENVPREYDIYVSAKREKLHNITRKVASWLLKSGYRRLEDSYDPEIYRMAYYSGDAEILNYLEEYGRTTLKFDCTPQRWLKSGEKTIHAVDNMVLTNPTDFSSKPLLEVTGSGNGNLFIGGKLIMLVGIQDSLTIDSETLNVYKGNQNCNNKMQGLFPEFGKSTLIHWNGGITGVGITPRWYTI